MVGSSRDAFSNQVVAFKKAYFTIRICEWILIKTSEIISPKCVFFIYFSNKIGHKWNKTQQQ